jgi:hypothetical protein
MPDSDIRVFMFYKPLAKVIAVKNLTLPTNKRIGFTAVEWGGGKID